MVRFLLASNAGWMSTIVVLMEIAFPYWLRRFLRGSGGSAVNVRRAPHREPMWLHYWLGYLIVSLVMLHASLSMGPIVKRADGAGLGAAMLAFCLLLLQIGLGTYLQTAAGTYRRVARRVHFWSMVLLTLLLPVHVWRNG
jgi:hypothetical protein